MTDDDTAQTGQLTSEVDYVAARRQIAARLAVPASAFSIDGRSFAFEAPLDAALPLGAFVELRAATGQIYLGQVLTKNVVQRDGPELAVEGDAGLGLSGAPVRIAQTTFRVRLRHVEGTGVLLARLHQTRIEPPRADDLFENAEIRVAPAAAVSRYLDGQHRGHQALTIGSIAAGDGRVPAQLLAAGFDRHTFLCGQSGSGKTFALGTILERLLLDTELRMVIVDPNSDFVRLGELRGFVEVAATLPGGFTTADYDAIRARFEAIASRIRVLRPTRRGEPGDDALRIRFSDLNALVQSQVLQLDPLIDRDEYTAYWSIVERLHQDHYSLADIRAAAARDLSLEARRVALRIDNLGVADWDVWAEVGESSVAEIGDDWRVLVLDLSGFVHQAEKSLVANAVLGALWGRREERRPVLLVVDEAHNVCPQEPSEPLQASATERAIQIAGEGRKYGLYLLVSTQRPQKLHVNVISQCDNLVLMRMNSIADLDRLAELFSFVPASLLGKSSLFTQGEALIAGKIAPALLLARFEGRLTREGGGDVPVNWAERS